MPDNRTFADLKTPSPAEPREGGGPTRPSPVTATIGRSVLPRVQKVGDAVRLVHEDRERYETSGHLGEGAMGEVRRARDHDIGRDVAIKRLHASLRHDGGVSRFVSEVRTVGALEHPNIVPIHDVGVDAEGNYFFVMKYVDGLTVEQILRGLRAGDAALAARFPLDQRLAIVRGVLHALEYAHARGIVHRDVKPANVMVGPYGEVVLMDWGIAKVVGGAEASLHSGVDHPAVSATSTRMGAMVGTPAYMSPEQFRGELDKIDATADLYALGVMTYELVTLENPATAYPDVDAVKAYVLGREAVWHHGVPMKGPADLLWLCWRATNRDPAQRFPSARAMLDELDAIAAGQCRVDCQVTFLKRTSGSASRFIDRRPMLALALAMGIAMSGVGLVAAVVTLGVALAAALALA